MSKLPPIEGELLVFPCSALSGRSQRERNSKLNSPAQTLGAGSPATMSAEDVHYHRDSTEKAQKAGNYQVKTPLATDGEANWLVEYYTLARSPALHSCTLG